VISWCFRPEISIPQGEDLNPYFIPPSFEGDETDPNARRWIDEYARGLDLQIERARLEEEREH